MESTEQITLEQKVHQLEQRLLQVEQKVGIGKERPSKQQKQKQEVQSQQNDNPDQQKQNHNQQQSQQQKEKKEKKQKEKKEKKEKKSKEKKEEPEKKNDQQQEQEQEQGDMIEELNVEQGQQKKREFEEGTYLGVPLDLIKKKQTRHLIGEILRIKNVFDEYEQWINKVGIVAGWARTARPQANNTLVFIDLNDGSQLKGLQIVVTDKLSNFQEVLKANTSFSFRIRGKFVESPGASQKIEMLLDDNEEHYVKILGTADNKKYPLAAKFHKPETLRDIAHLRPRTNLIGAVARVRNNLIMATHLFFQSRGFINVHTPIITASDCEGAGSMFQVTTLMDKNVDQIPHDKDSRQISYEKDFFKKPAFMTVSGQLAVENYCCAMSNVYTFGPTFRAEISHTQKHLAEFWMIEPEIAFGDINDCMDLAEDYIKFSIKYILENNMDDVKFFDERVKKGQVEYLSTLCNSEFKKLTYTQCIEILEKAIKGKKVKFENSIKWGDDMASEHEKYISDKVVKGPVHVYNYPRDIKSFYMKNNNEADPERQTVACVDVLVPKIGELIGGSQREDSLELLEERMIKLGLNPQDYWWYLDLRRFGTVPHSGFGLGFERLVMMITGVENIRDVIPFPRTVGNAEF